MPLVVGPILPLLRAIGLHGPSLVLATAYYSRRPLEWLAAEARAEAFTFLGRLDFDNPSDVERGFIDPHALLNFSRALADQGRRLEIYVSPRAHAKIYVGSAGAIVGSANLTTRGFGAGSEIVELIGQEGVREALEAVRHYSAAFTRLGVDQLEAFVERNQRRITASRQLPESEDRLPPTRESVEVLRPPRSGPGRVQRATTSIIGDYEDFVRWVERQNSPAAHEIAARAHGKSQLQGHIRHNFSGLRQFLLANPDQLSRFMREDPDTYKLSADPATEAAIARFVTENASDEAEFSLDIWKTYLPRETGGRAARHGGTIGNLNRMLPLVARYLARRISVIRT